MTDTQREAFEKLLLLDISDPFNRINAIAKDNNNDYLYEPSKTYYKFWQAALAQSQAEKAELVEALEEATLGLSNGLWDYGPGQDEHEQCDILLEKLRALIAKVKR